MERGIEEMGERGMEQWATEGRWGPHKWKGGWVEALARAQRGRAELAEREAIARRKKAREDKKRTRREHEDEEKSKREAEQAEKAAKKLRASQGTKRRPVAYMVRGLADDAVANGRRGGGGGYYIKTGRVGGRNKGWLVELRRCTPVSRMRDDPKFNRGLIRAAVEGGYLRWSAEEGDGQEGRELQPGEEEEMVDREVIGTGGVEGRGRASPEESVAEVSDSEGSQLGALGGADEECKDEWRPPIRRRAKVDILAYEEARMCSWQESKDEGKGRSGGGGERPAVDPYVQLGAARGASQQGIKRAYMQRVQGMHPYAVLVCDAQQGELNGKLAVVRSWDAEAARYVVEVENGASGGGVVARLPERGIKWLRRRRLVKYDVETMDAWGLRPEMLKNLHGVRRAYELCMQENQVRVAEMQDAHEEAPPAGSTVRTGGDGRTRRGGRVNAGYGTRSRGERGKGVRGADKGAPTGPATSSPTHTPNEHARTSRGRETTTRRTARKPRRDREGIG